MESFLPQNPGRTQRERRQAPSASNWHRASNWHFGEHRHRRAPTPASTDPSFLLFSGSFSSLFFLPLLLLSFCRSTLFLSRSCCAAASYLLYWCYCCSFRAIAIALLVLSALLVLLLPLLLLSCFLSALSVQPSPEIKGKFCCSCCLSRLWAVGRMGMLS